ncbi:hypothetical protein HOV00_gp55 [Microbacterium phage Schubert]|uniref:Uncharacterized protein n=1 Tax=Microbacterium phage Schubert TaxID=2500787 RepID=A0A3T0INS7_9CAUD|nr:hypothetical protein HOV00_gp55 [Microbacterium phage Schubert]AZV01744.1 hypothetical protein SEA_SCHUBERT_38 [Microbacterium phage Schubert]
MAKSTAAVLDDEVVEEAPEPTAKQIVNEGIVRVIEATGIDVQKNRYKAMRAIAFQAFVEAIEAGDFDGLVDRAIANVDELPSGWEIEKPVKGEAQAKPAAKKATAKATKAAPAKKAPAKTTRRRPTR